MSAPEYRNIGKSASDLLTKNFVGKKSNSLLVKFGNTKNTYNAEITLQKKGDSIEGTAKETLKCNCEKFEKLKPEFTCELKSNKQFTGTVGVTPDLDIDVDLSGEAKFVCSGREDNGLTLDGTVSHEKFRFNAGVLAYPTKASDIPGSDDKKKLINYNAELTIAAVDKLSIGGQVSGNFSDGLPNKYAAAFTYDISDNIQGGAFFSQEQSKFEDEDNENKLSNKKSVNCGFNVFHKVNSNVSIAAQLEHTCEKVSVVGAKKENGESSTKNKNSTPYLFTVAGQFNTPELDGTLKLKVNTKKVGSCAYNTKLSESLSLTLASEVEDVLAIDNLKHKYGVNFTFDF
jgi:hypothetical protein|eukprot:TRINITY_DN15395_c0_g1_i1.p1 TRINITY_DN15395_c0_g1~~TRINITY_DN15395_c0_g1_i1.p1  ORF type:complete len:344 (+),score=104.33 TRINITY_DN15395_c0_g1_i1:60-1091(+)